MTTIKPRQTEDPWRMQFENFGFGNDLQCTIRKGGKWLGRLSIGQKFQIFDPQNECWTMVDVAGILYCNYHEVPSGLIELAGFINHEELRQYLKKFYKKFASTELVTVVIFKKPQGDPQKFLERFKDDD